jgi:hypothetical protein
MKRRDFVFSLGGLAVALAGEAKDAGRSDGQESGFPSPGMTASLPETSAANGPQNSRDWLVTRFNEPTRVYRSDHPNELVMSNGLIRRCWRLKPNAATVAFDNLMTGPAILRAVKPEGYVTFDRQEYPIGGLLGQPDCAYLTAEWLDRLTSDPKAFRWTGFEIGTTKEPFAWKRTRFSGNQPWPPPGASFTLRFEPGDSPRQGLEVYVHYEMFDGIPVLSKWFSICNNTEKAVRLNRLLTEVLAAVEYESEPRLLQWQHPNLQVESDYHWDNVHWEPDPQYTTQVDYGKQKGITLGCYSLLASRNISQEDDVINPKTMTIDGAVFDHSPCLGSKWGINYFRKLYAYFEKTGMGVLEHDGSYPGDVCASTRHPGHRGLEDSQWTQWKTITDFYQWCRGRGIYLNVPDTFFLSGENKTGMGYRETDWSLPRAQQVVIGRQNIFDGTWRMTPSMGWMFVPIVEYHAGGGAAAAIEPLREHLDVYGQILAQNLGSGVQAAYRGLRLYDAEESTCQPRSGFL